MPQKEKKKEDVQERNIEVENLLGNLMISQYQIVRLQERLSDKVERGYGNSIFMYKHNNAWYKVLITIQKQEENKPAE